MIASHAPARPGLRAWHILLIIGASATRALAFYGYLFVSISGLLAACAGADRRVEQPSDTRSPADERRGAEYPNVEIILIPEMLEFANELRHAVPIVAERDLACFSASWCDTKKMVAAAITPSLLAKNSRWAAQQTARFSLPPGWTDNLPMRPIGASEDSRYLLFGHTLEESTAELPAHLPIVHRRVVVAAVMDRDLCAIIKVFVSIRGWVEE